ncbi:MAG: phospho-N-acetylmuramoyl-pentapeptide-transferase [Deltaproteobacteria bacterium RIFCSPLOWO2_12_FULL_40_28]|nr:MAG: phospho-N-acetylmuramoyl-pentapeptide-transferase [Deltaproteobacteria bacterium RIFCSPHIGHO2_02_FULL_40_28]OGQ19175.1 MAG: phospho-N-acetylmuramoyl-pentapeptide-transferase [Deltaproteobacteria bacterium RIFCSPHIGHO2_12_FULL_40_32]OGQ39791.1 MAG: phospho-N-acetylmuramoyl-pentapeptide-transferase [Deltaproteobacteria bacterium RIFCSPLOWO2_02_FULL_40_36]OGQ53627.1 MAG: phospho-N-acetylmuramoyl-pentapeptide-transferase [Deltaproteobacteria bacterium RIFCSPLOWO2_12_FULL_40_28]
MLYHLLYPLHDLFGGFNVVKYITFRSFVALFTSLFLFFAFGGKWIAYLKLKQFSQIIRDDGPQTHLGKKGTPTMGGVLLVGCITVSVLLWTNLTNSFVWACLFVLLSMSAIGFIDDYRKVVKKDAKGFPGRYKIILEVIICLVVALWLYGYQGLDTKLYFPFAKGFQPDLSAGYLFLTLFVVVGCANAVNLTDGLDGLVSIPSMTSFSTYALFTYIAGNAVISNYLQLPYVSQAAEVSVVCGAVAGALLAFLWYNAYPADIFLGDVGALGLGGLLGLVALMAKQEILLIMIGGLFVLETLSVITQVISFKFTGQRIFRMAPLHHHFELKGWSEPKVIVRFWIISFILALLSLATLKLR